MPLLVLAEEGRKDVEKGQDWHIFALNLHLIGVLDELSRGSWNMPHNMICCFLWGLLCSSLSFLSLIAWVPLFLLQGIF